MTRVIAVRGANEVGTAPRYDRGVRQRWFSRRAVCIHVGALAFIPLCLLAWWWQVSRAFDGNDLSYLYAVEWPLFALIGVYLWWALIHTDFDTVGAKAQQAAIDRGEVSPEPETERRPEEEDPALAAYNDRLAALSRQGPKTWRRL
jgi:hypothetical protein